MFAHRSLRRLAPVLSGGSPLSCTTLNPGIPVSFHSLDVFTELNRRSAGTVCRFRLADGFTRRAGCLQARVDRVPCVEHRGRTLAHITEDIVVVDVLHRGRSTRLDAGVGLFKTLEAGTAMRAPLPGSGGELCPTPPAQPQPQGKISPRHPERSHELAMEDRT